MRSKLGEISDEMIEKGEAVKGVTGEQAQCIMKVSKCGNLITWLQENVQGQYYLNYLPSSRIMLDMPDMSGRGLQDCRPFGRVQYTENVRQGRHKNIIFVGY